MKDKQPKTAKKEAPKEALKKEDKPKAYVRRPRSKKKPGEIAAFGLHSLKTPRGAHKKRKYLGRGPSSGHGKTSTRGSKGQTSRSGRHFYLGFEGGQSPLIRRFPKRGFVSNFKKVYQIINLSDLNRVKETLISPEVMEDKGLIKHKDRLIKILGDGEIKNAVTVQAHAFSRQAQEKIQKAGGKTELINVQAR